MRTGSVARFPRYFFLAFALVFALSDNGWTEDVWIGAGDCLRRQISNTGTLTPVQAGVLEADVARLRNSGESPDLLSRDLVDLAAHYASVHSVGDLARVLRLRIEDVETKNGHNSKTLIPLLTEQAEVEGFGLGHPDLAIKAISRAIAIAGDEIRSGPLTQPVLVEKKAWLGHVLKTADGGIPDFRLVRALRHTDAADTLDEAIATLWLGTGLVCDRSAEGEPFVEEAMKLLTRHYGGDDPRWVNVYLCVAQCRSREGRHQEALEFAERAHLNLSKQPVMDELLLGHVLFARGVSAKSLGRTDAAKADLKKAYDLLHARLSPESPTIRDLAPTVALALVDGGEVEGAITLLVALLKEQESRLPAGHPATEETRAALGRFGRSIPASPVARTTVAPSAPTPPPPAVRQTEAAIPTALPPDSLPLPALPVSSPAAAASRPSGNPLLSWAAAGIALLLLGGAIVKVLVARQKSRETVVASVPSGVERTYLCPSCGHRETGTSSVCPFCRSSMSPGA